MQSDADLGIISAEFFSRARPRDLRRMLVENTPDLVSQTRVLAYVRPHTSWVVSAYSTKVKTGGTCGTLSEFACGMSSGPFLNYAQRFGRWRRVFQEAFILQPFLRAELYQEDVVADFFQTALSGAEFSLDSPVQANSSLSLEEIVAMRVVQKELTERGLPRPLRLALGAAIGRELGRQVMRRTTKLSLDRKSAEVIYKACHEDAKALDQRFWGRPVMQSALEQDVERASAAAQSLKPDAYFTAEELHSLKRVSVDLADALHVAQKDWRRSYRDAKLTGQISLPQDEVKFLQVQQVWNLITCVSDIMTASTKVQL